MLVRRCNTFKLMAKREMEFDLHCMQCGHGFNEDEIVSYHTSFGIQAHNSKVGRNQWMKGTASFVSRECDVHHYISDVLCQVCKAMHNNHSNGDFISSLSGGTLRRTDDVLLKLCGLCKKYKPRHEFMNIEWKKNASVTRHCKICTSVSNDMARVPTYKIQCTNKEGSKGEQLTARPNISDLLHISDRRKRCCPTVVASKKPRVAKTRISRSAAT